MTKPSYQYAIDIQNLNFDFGGPLILKELSLQLPPGSRCLLIGANGAGKSTLLRLLAGKRLCKGHIKVMDKMAFYEAPAGVTYLGTEWAGNPIVRRDVPVSRLLKSQGAERLPDRCKELLEIMDVDPNWHMHQVSDGQRRRVQIVLGLLEPWEILLLDEVTVDLDVVVRANLLQYLKRETENRGASIVYATHIFDGLGGFPTHVVHMASGHVDIVREINRDFYELDQERQLATVSKDIEIVDNSPLLRVVEKWLRKDYSDGSKGEASVKTKWDILSENMRQYGDKFYNYWN